LSGQETPTEPAIVRLQRRSEFLAAARGARVNRSAFLLQALPRPEPERIGTIGIGVTVTRKIGNAVTATVPDGGCALPQLPGPAAALDYVWSPARPLLLCCSGAAGRAGGNRPDRAPPRREPAAACWQSR
jgi:hypothetical protein